MLLTGPRVVSLIVFYGVYWETGGVKGEGKSR
jgi:hypothetical protein